MTPKEKAEELIDKIHDAIDEHSYCTFPSCKKAALIAVDELIEHTDWTEVDYWQQVKQEIEKL